MIDKNEIRQIVEQNLDSNDYFIVDITVGADEKITVYIDKFNGNITLDDCEKLHSKIYPKLEELYDNFDLTVSSPGLTSGLKVWQQYYKNIGQEIEILQTDGKTIRGKILEADENQVKIQTKNQIITLPYDHIKKAKLILKF